MRSMTWARPPERSHCKPAAQGLTTHTMAGFDHDAARQIFQIPDDYPLGAVIALGYQGDPAALSQPQLVSLETARARANL